MWFKILIDAGADPAVQSSDGFTPLHAVAEFCKNSNTEKLLLESGAETNAEATSYLTDHGQSPRAKRKTLLGEVFDVVMLGPFRSWTPVVSAAGSYDNRLALHDGWIPLHSAAKFSEDASVIEVLLEKGADPCAQLRLSNKGGSGNICRLATCNAARFMSRWNLSISSRASAIKHLLEISKGLDGATAMHVAAAFNANPVAVEALVSGGATVWTHK